MAQRVWSELPAAKIIYQANLHLLTLNNSGDTAAFAAPPSRLFVPAACCGSIDFIHASCTSMFSQFSRQQLYFGQCARTVDATPVLNLSTQPVKKIPVTPLSPGKFVNIGTSGSRHPCDWLVVTLFLLLGNSWYNLLLQQFAPFVISSITARCSISRRCAGWTDGHPIIVLSTFFLSNCSSRRTTTTAATASMSLFRH